MTAMPNIIAFRPLPVDQPLRRPSILIRAARAGQAGWRRSRDLPRLLRSDTCPRPGSALPRLRAEEAQMDVARKEGDAGYDLQRHVLLMIAILAEMRAAVAETSAAVAIPGIRAAISARGTAIPARP
ncbi:DUF6477 family protein [Paracoccus zhejiangensis]|uniref:DUF6477 family protein n=1 Tax=Paracoccus zhejiangensis TaxID=1077935 RepID=UPI0018E416D5|nr:DUF6477 family protein [Paracoccus zhejiangensis]